VVCLSDVVAVLAVKLALLDRCSEVHTPDVKLASAAQQLLGARPHVQDLKEELPNPIRQQYAGCRRDWQLQRPVPGGRVWLRQSAIRPVLQHPGKIVHLEARGSAGSGHSRLWQVLVQDRLKERSPLPQ
jgi:hypothetical protein